MTSSRLGKIRQCVKSDGYFVVLAKQLELIQREMNNPTRKRRGERLLMSLMGDMEFLQMNYRIVKRKLIENSEIL